MGAPELATDNPDIVLVPIDIERDAPAGVRWLSGPVGRETLRLMGVTDENNQESDLETERRRLHEIIANPHEDAWMIQYAGEIVGIVEVALEDSEFIAAPTISIMIGDASARGRGVGKSSLQATLSYLGQTGYAHAYARHLVDNGASAALLAKCGFRDDGAIYADADGLEWQNMQRMLEASE